MTRSESIATFDLTAPDWQAVHQAIDDVFDELESRIRRARPELSSRRERVQAARFQFNYRAFDPPVGRGDREPLVVGIRFDPLEDHIHVTGDICTEESGRLLHEEPGESHAPSARELATAAGDVAHRLAAQWTLIVDHFSPPHS